MSNDMQSIFGEWQQSTDCRLFCRAIALRKRPDRNLKRSGIDIALIEDQVVHVETGRPVLAPYRAAKPFSKASDFQPLLYANAKLVIFDFPLSRE